MGNYPRAVGSQACSCSPAAPQHIPAHCRMHSERGCNLTVWCTEHVAGQKEHLLGKAAKILPRCATAQLPPCTPNSPSSCPCLLSLGKALCHHLRFSSSMCTVSVLVFLSSPPFFFFAEEVLEQQGASLLLLLSVLPAKPRSGWWWQCHHICGAGAGAGLVGKLVAIEVFIN